MVESDRRKHYFHAFIDEYLKKLRKFLKIDVAIARSGLCELVAAYYLT